MVDWKQKIKFAQLGILSILPRVIKYHPPPIISRLTNFHILNRILHIFFLLTLVALSLSAQGSGVPTVSYPDHSLWPESPRTASFQKTIIPQAGVLTGLGRNGDFVDFAYDGSGRLYQDSSRGISDIFYDNDGNRTQTITENGTIYDFYDGAGNHLRTEYSENGKPTVVREYTGAGHIITDSIVTRTPCPGGYFSGRGGYPLYYLTDFQGNNIATLNCLGATVSSHRYYPYGEPWREPTREEFLFSGNERVRYDGLNDYDFHARRYNAAVPRFDKQDIRNGEYPWLSPYAYCAGNPVNLIDKDGNSPTVLTAVVGTAVGAVVGGGIEIFSQIYKNGTVKNWRAVGGAVAGGAVSGLVAGLTLGMGSAAAIASSAAGSAAGGVVERAVNGEKTTLADVAADATAGATLGTAGEVAGRITSNLLNKTSIKTKGKIGEAVSNFKYHLKGNYKPTDQSPRKVSTGTKTPTGINAHAVYDHYFVNAITKKPMIVESKYNTSGLTHNQTLALPHSAIPVQIDRTTSEQLGNGVRSMFMMVGPSVSQIYGYDE